MAWEIVSPEDGQSCGMKYVRDATEADNPALVFDVVPDGAVWDAASGKPRPVNDTEKLAAAKTAKKRELEAAFANETSASFGGGSDAVFVAVGTGFMNPQDARVTAFRARTQKLQTRLSQVDAASTEAAVAAVAW